MTQKQPGMWSAAGRFLDIKHFDTDIDLYSQVKLPESVHFNLLTHWRKNPFATYYQQDNIGKFGGAHPAGRLRDVVEEFGIPDVIDRSPNGLAIWYGKTIRELNKRNRCFERVELHDEQVPTCSTIPHCEFLYASFKMNIPANKTGYLHAISESITYDALKQMITIRHHFMGGIKAVAMLVKRYATGAYTLKRAIDEVGPSIMGTVHGSPFFNPTAEDDYLDELNKYYDQVYAPNEPFYKYPHTTKCEKLPSVVEFARKNNTCLKNNGSCTYITKLW